MSGLLISVGAGGTMTGTGVFTGVIGIQWVKRSRRLEMDVRCSWWMVPGDFLTAQDRKLRAWKILLSAETVG